MKNCLECREGPNGYNCCGHAKKINDWSKRQPQFCFKPRNSEGKPSSLSHATPKPLDASNGRRIPVESRSDSERDRL